MLQRAAGLLTTQGEPVQAFQDAFRPQDTTSQDQELPSGGASENLRRSLSKRLSKVKTTQVVRSLRGNGQIRNRHGRASSDACLDGVHTAGIHTLLEIAQTASPRSPTNLVIQAPSQKQPQLLARKSSMADVPVPLELQHGVPMTKISPRSQKSYNFRLDADQGQIIWESKKRRISAYNPFLHNIPPINVLALTRAVPIESIKELRSSLDARYYRQQFQLSSEYEDRWITIIYILDGQYKTLHLIASSKDTFQLWDITLRKIHAVRQQLMTGLGNEEMRHAVWLRQCWKSSDQRSDQKLGFEEVEKLCRRLNINSSQEDLLRLFNVCFFLRLSAKIADFFQSKRILSVEAFLIFQTFGSLSSSSRDAQSSTFFTRSYHLGPMESLHLRCSSNS